MKQKKALLLGSYGQSNLGDDLLMWNYLELLRDRGFRQIYVNANTTEHIPDVIKKSFPDLKVVNTYHTSIIDYIRLIRQVDYVVYGGGTIYKELYRSTGRTPYSVIIRLMLFNLLTRLLGTQLYHLHIGTGSLTTRRGRRITKLALNAATQTIFRDQQSYDFAKNTLGIHPSKIQKSTDGLFINPIWKEAWNNLPLNLDRQKYKQIIGINMLSDIPDWVDRSHYIASMRRLVKTLLNDSQTYLVFIPFQHAFNPHNDLLFMKETFGDILARNDNYFLPEKVSIDKVSALLKQCDVFIGMRFHSLLLAAAVNVPFVAITYDTKCWRFVQEIGYEYAVKLEKLEHVVVINLLDDVMKAKKKIKSRLDRAVKHLYQEAEEGIRTLSL